MARFGGSVGGKWRQLYLTNNEKREKKEKKSTPLHCHAHITGTGMRLAARCPASGVKNRKSDPCPETFYSLH